MEVLTTLAAISVVQGWENITTDHRIPYYRYILIGMLEFHPMELSAKTRYSLISLMLTSILLFKYPQDPHEYGKDSYIVHGMATNLQNLDSAPWLIEPLSAYALYPFSYAPGMAFLLTALSDISGLSIELVILLFTIIISMIGALGMFMFAAEISERFEVKFLSGFLFAFTPAITTFTTWTISTRGPFICLMTILLWAFARTINARHKAKVFVVGLILLFTMPTIHHFSLLFPIILLAYLSSYLTALGLEYTGKMSIYYRENVAITSMIVFAIMAFLFYLQVTAVDIYSPHLDYFRVWYLNEDESSPLTLAMNIVVYYGMAMGVLMIYGGLGLANVLSKTDKTRMEWTLLFLILFFTLFLVDKTYLKMFVVPLFLPLASIGIIALLDRLEYRKVMYASMFGCLLIIAAYHGSFATQQFSDVRTVNDTGYHHFMDPEPYNTAIYLKHTIYEKNGPFAITNDEIDKRRISGISGLMMMPFEESEMMVVYPEIKEKVSIKQHTVFDMYYEHDDRVFYIDWSDSEQTGYDNYSRIRSTVWNTSLLTPTLSEYRISWALTNMHFPEETGTSSHPFQNAPSPFFASLPHERYCLYENEYQRIYFLIPT